MLVEESQRASARLYHDSPRACELLDFNIQCREINHESLVPDFWKLFMKRRWHTSLICEALILNYLKVTKLRVGLILTFATVRLGYKRRVL